MRSSCFVAISLYLMGATVAAAQAPQRSEGPGLKAQEDSRYAKGGLGLPSDHLMGGQGGELLAIRMLAYGYAGRPK